MKVLSLVALALLLGACGKSTQHDSPTALQDLAGQWVLVNYWAQWCKPCIEEIPELNDFDRQRTDVTVLGVNFEGATGEELAAQEAKLGVAFPTVEDVSAQLGIPRPAVLPTTLVIDPQGKLVDQLLGPQTARSLEQAISQADNPS